MPEGVLLALLLHDVPHTILPDPGWPQQFCCMPAGMPAIRQSLNDALARVPPARQCVAAQALATQVSNNMHQWEVALSLLRRALGLPQQPAEGFHSQVTLPHSMSAAPRDAQLSICTCAIPASPPCSCSGAMIFHRVQCKGLTDTLHWAHHESCTTCCRLHLRELQSTGCQPQQSCSS